MKSEVRKAAREKQARLAIYSGRERDRQEDRKPEYWGATSGNGYAQTELQSCVANGRLQLNDAYPEEAEQPDRLWVGSGDSGVVS